MKKCYSLVLISFLLYACGNKTKSADVSEFLFSFEAETIPFPFQYDPSDSIQVKLEVYEVNDKLYLLLDSIIGSVSRCPHFKDEKIGFLFSHYDEGVNSLMEIENIDMYFYNPAKCHGVFFYKDYTFFCINNFMNGFFEHTKRYIIFKGVKPEKYFTEMDDRSSYWRYIYENNSFKIISLVNCENAWWEEK